jgi:hypothetical protein
VVPRNSRPVSGAEQPAPRALESEKPPNEYLQGARELGERSLAGLAVLSPVRRKVSNGYRSAGENSPTLSACSMRQSGCISRTRSPKCVPAAALKTRVWVGQDR